MMHHQHHHTIPQNQLQRGDPSRMGQQTHRMMANQQRGHTIMLGVPGASPVPSPGAEPGRHPRQLFLCLLIFLFYTGECECRDITFTSRIELAKMFNSAGCIEGVLVTMPSVPVQAIPPQPTVSVSVHQPQTVQQQQQVPQMLHSQQQHVGGSEMEPQDLASNKLQSQQQHSTTMSNAAGALSPSNVTGSVNLASNSVSGGDSPSTCAAAAAYGLANNKEKTPMCLVNELARYNKIQHVYRLTGEQGPAHKKRFTVALKLSTEEYEAEGASIKKAQHAAASEALMRTKFKHPPPKTTRNLRIGGNKNGGPAGHLTPTVELNALAMKRGEPTVYLVEMNQTPYVGPPVNGAFNNGYHRSNMYSQQTQRYSNYDARRSYNGRGHYTPHFDNQRYQNYQYGGKPHSGWHVPGNPGDTYTVTLRVGPREFTGEGATAQAARHDAASRALHELRQLPLPDSAPLDANTCPAAKNETIAATAATADDLICELKSPISLVHEIALKRNLNVIFEVQSEKGLPHMKVFVTTCRVADIITEGEGNGKKISKKRAAEKMLEELKKLPPLSPTNMIGLPARMKRKPAVTKKKTRSLIKVYQEKSEPEFSEEINPISRLIQIQQAKKEKEPVYNLLEERGAARRREFVMEVTIGQHAATGTGPNKKQAKRAAAEALLIQLGYTQQTSQANVIDKPIKQSVSVSVDVSDKHRKVTFLEEKVEPQSSSGGGTSGRQLVPGLLLMGDQSNTTFSASKAGVNIQTTATIAKEFLKAGNSPTADAIAKGHNSKLMASQSSQQVHKPATTQVIRPKEQLMYLSQLLDFQVQFSDFPKANHEEFLTLLSLSTDPPQVCHGAGESTDESHDAAALTALRVLSEMGLDNVGPTKKDSSLNLDGVHNQKNNIKSNIISNGLKK